LFIGRYVAPRIDEESIECCVMEREMALAVVFMRCMWEVVAIAEVKQKL